MLQLYDDFVKQVYDFCKNKYLNMGKELYKRFLHIEGVCKMATLLANKYNVDVKKAQICAILHDFYKYESYDEMSQYLSKSEILECKNCNVLYHSYASSKVLSRVFGINDEEMANAIKYHVFGHLHMTKLEEIILISDYTEFNREYKDCVEVREILLNGDLNLAIYESTLRTINFLKSQNIEPHPMQFEVLKEYERKIKNE